MSRRGRVSLAAGVGVLACLSIAFWLSGGCDVPLHAYRRDPPAGIETRVKPARAVASPLALAATTGGTFSLVDELQHGPVVLVFYRGHWWPDCRRQLGELQSRLADFTARHATIAAISVDPIDKSRDLASSLGLTFPLLSDPQLASIRDYGVADEDNGIAWPSVFVVAQDGTIAWRQTATKVSVRPSVDEILAGLAVAASEPASAP